jgi:hypothetical protein
MVRDRVRALTLILLLYIHKPITHPMVVRSRRLVWILAHTAVDRFQVGQFLSVIV